MAYTGLKARNKSGWNMLFLGTIVNLLYGIFSLFDNSHGGAGSLFGAIIASAISFYFLYQIRSYYVSKTTALK
jgi:hypothetical protein